MLEFNRKFPLLKGKQNLGEISDLIGNYKFDYNILIADVENCCVDKSRVKEAVLGFFQKGDSFEHSNDCECVGCKILKKLGLKE